MLGAKQQLVPASDYLPARHLKADFFSKFYFRFHGFHFLGEIF